MKASLGIFILVVLVLMFGLLAGSIWLVLGGIVLFIIAVYLRDK